MSAALAPVVLALADDELVLGHRHSEWTGFGPHIEEDIAFSSIAQDEIGHATAYYRLVAAHTGDDPDRLALGRAPSEYRHAIVCERPNGDWAYTLTRHWLYDHADSLRLASLAESKHADLAALAAKMRREERYHLLHADAWLERIARGPVEARRRIIDALTIAFDEALGLFEPLPEEGDALAEGILPEPSETLRARFMDEMSARLERLELPRSVQGRAAETAEFIASSSGDLIAGDEAGDGVDRPGAALGGRRGRHGPDFDSLWEVMTATYRADPGASW